MEALTALDISVRADRRAVVLTLTSEVGSEVVIEEIRIQSPDPSRLLDSLSHGAARSREQLGRPAA